MGFSEIFPHAAESLWDLFSAVSLFDYRILEDSLALVKEAALFGLVSQEENSDILDHFESSNFPTFA